MTSCVIHFAIPQKQPKCDGSKHMDETGQSWPLEQHTVTLHDLKPELLGHGEMLPILGQLDKRGFAVFKNESKTLGPLNQQLKWNSAYLEVRPPCIRQLW